MNVGDLKSEVESSPQSGPPRKRQFQEGSRQLAGDPAALGLEIGVEIVVFEAVCDEVGRVFAEFLNQEKVRIELAQDAVKMDDVCPATEQVGRHQPDGSVHGRSTLTGHRAHQIVGKVLRSRLGRWTYMPSEYV